MEKHIYDEVNMVEKIVDCIVKSQTSSGKIKQEENSVYLYGYTLLFEKLINIVIVLLISFVTGRWIEIWVFLFAVIPLRSFVGGWHAKKFWQCTVISNAAVILLLVIIEKIIIKNQFFYAVFEITIGILMCWLVLAMTFSYPTVKWLLFFNSQRQNDYEKIIAMVIFRGFRGFSPLTRCIRGRDVSNAYLAMVTWENYCGK